MNTTDGLVWAAFGAAIVYVWLKKSAPRAPAQPFEPPERQQIDPNQPFTGVIDSLSVLLGTDEPTTGGTSSGSSGGFGSGSSTVVVMGDCN